MQGGTPTQLLFLCVDGASVERKDGKAAWVDQKRHHKGAFWERKSHLTSRRNVRERSLIDQP